MKTTRRRRILIVALLAAALVMLVLLLPPVQTSLVRSLAGGVDGVDVTLDRVSAGPWGATLDGLQLAAPGIEIQVPHAEVDLGFWSSVGHLALVVEDATVSGIQVRIGRLPERAEMPDERGSFNGIAPLMRLPKRLVAHRVAVDGSVELMLSDAISIQGPWSVSATDLGPDRQVDLSMEASLEAMRDAEVIAAAVVEGALKAAIDDSGAVTALETDAGVHAASDEPRGIDAQLVVKLANERESYDLAVDTSSGRRLVESTTNFDRSRKVLESRWEMAVTPDTLQSFARGRALPELALRSSGSARFETDRGRLEIDGSGHLEGRGWADLDPRLREVDEVIADVTVSAALAGGQLDARQLRIAVSDSAGRRMLGVTGMQPVTIDLEGWRFIPQSWGEPALRLEADRVPLRWTRGFDESVRVESGDLSAAIDIVPIDSRHAEIATHQPIRVAGLRLRTPRNESATRNLDLTVVPRITLDNGELEAAIEDSRLTTPTGLDVRFIGLAATSRQRWPEIGLDGELSLVVPKLRQLDESLERISGRARFELDLGSLVMAVDGGALDVADAQGRSLMAVRFDNDEPLRFEFPGMRPDWESSTPQRLEVVFDAFPIAWVSRFIPELELDDGALYGELQAVTGGGLGLTLESRAPFELRDLQPVYRGLPFATGSTASVEPRLRLENEAVRVAFENFKVRTPDRDRLDGTMTLIAPRGDPRRIDASLVVEGEFPSVTNRIGKLGALSWRQEVVIDIALRRLEVDELEVGLSDAVGTRFLELSSVRPFFMTAEPFSVGVEAGSPDILQATVTPLELQQLFPTILGFSLEGVLPQGEFVGRVDDGGLLLAADEPLVFRDVTVSWEGAALLDRVTIGLEYQVLYSADGLEARSIDFSTFGPRGSQIAEATLRAVMPLTDRSTISNLYFETLANLEPLTRQPVLSGLPAFLEGTIGGSVDVAYGERSRLVAELALRGARIENAGVLPDLTGALDLRAVSGERLEVTAPLTLSSVENGASDLDFEGTVVRHADGVRFDASLAGERVVAPDVLRLLRLVASPDDDTGSRSSRQPPGFDERWSTTAIAQLRERRDATPVWGDRVSGQATLDIGAVQLSSYAVRNIRGQVVVDPSRVELTRAEASLLGAELAMTGGLGFDESADRPYGLRFESTISSLDLGKLFTAVDPAAPPTLEGLFEVRTEASGRGRNLADLGFGALGSVRVSGRDGVFRGLAGRYGLARTGAKVVGVLTFSKQLKAIGRLLEELEALEFDTFDLELARETPRRFAITELRVSSALAHIDGSGGIEVESGLPLAASPLDASLDMATNGDLTILFDGLGLLGDDEDQEGYRPLTRPVSVSGTVAEPDTSDFYDMLDDAAGDSKGVAGVAMRRINKKLQKSR